jgi:ABC-type uncharacterized transport system ATPase subunit
LIRRNNQKILTALQTDESKLEFCQSKEQGQQPTIILTSHHSQDFVKLLEGLMILRLTIYGGRISNVERSARKEGRGDLTRVEEVK